MLGPGLRSTDQQLRDDLHFFVNSTNTSLRQIALEAGVDQAALRKVFKDGQEGGLTTATHDKIRAALWRLSQRLATQPERPSGDPLKETQQ
jgi:hypothetical protein